MDLSPEKIFVVGIIAVMVLGPDRLPSAARTAGRMLAEFRRWSAGVQHEVTSAIAEPRDTLGRSATEMGLTDIRKTISGARLSWRGALNEVVNGATGPGPAALPRPVVDATAEIAFAEATSACEAGATAGHPTAAPGAPGPAHGPGPGIPFLVPDAPAVPGPGIPVLVTGAMAVPDD